MTVGLVASIATIPTASTAGLATGIALGLGALAGLGTRSTSLRRLLLPSLMGLCAVVLPWLLAGDLDRAARLGARALGVLGMALGLSGVHRAAELPPALRSLGAPAALAGVVATMLAQAEVAKDEGRRLVLARQLRGAVATAARAEVLSAWFARTVGRAERVDVARRLRGYDPSLAVRSASLRAADAPWLMTGLVVGSVPHAAAYLF